MKDFDDRFGSDSSTSSSLSFCLLSLDSMNEWTLFSSSTSFHLLLFVWLICVFGVSFYEQTFLEFLSRQDFLLSIMASRLRSQPFIMSFPYIYRQRRRWRRRRATWFQRKRQSVSPTSVPVVNRVLCENRIISLYSVKWISHFTHNNNGKRWKLGSIEKSVVISKNSLSVSFVCNSVSAWSRESFFLYWSVDNTNTFVCCSPFCSLTFQTKDCRKKIRNHFLVVDVDWKTSEIFNMHSCRWLWDFSPVIKRQGQSLA